MCSNYRGITHLRLPGKGAEEESSTASLASDTRGTMQFSFGPWEAGPALYPHESTEGGMGVCPIGLHVLYASGDGLLPCPPLLQDTQSLYC